LGSAVSLLSRISSKVELEMLRPAVVAKVEVIIHHIETNNHHHPAHNPSSIVFIPPDSELQSQVGERLAD
jgi:hypothetical protein